MRGPLLLSLCFFVRTAGDAEGSVRGPAAEDGVKMPGYMAAMDCRASLAGKHRTGIALFDKEDLCNALFFQKSTGVLTAIY